jgi:hypothetical protein
VRPPPPPLEPRAPAFASRRSGVIAIKAGMMQDWDEYGARVPLTVLWLDECMVRALGCCVPVCGCVCMCVCVCAPVDALQGRVMPRRCAGDRPAHACVRVTPHRVPLLQVVRHKHKERDGVTSLVLGCGAKRAKQLHPRQLGEFQVRGCVCAFGGEGVLCGRGGVVC